MKRSISTIATDALNFPSESSRRQRPTVIVAGWLGCRRKSLRRYEDFYNELGWDVAVCIASPAMIIASASGMNGREGRHRDASRTSPPNPESMHELAMVTLQKVGQNSLFLIHAFSNGGAFLWEAIRSILSSGEGGLSDSQLQNLKKNFLGIVFDSAPAFYIGSERALLKVLDHASNEEMKESLNVLAKARAEIGSKRLDNALRVRARQYWEGMKNHEWGLPQLYLYSDIDDLAPCGPIDELVLNRQERFGRDMVKKSKFTNSSHCSHLRTHPLQYRSSLGLFLLSCLARHGRGDIRSRL